MSFLSVRYSLVHTHVHVTDYGTIDLAIPHLLSAEDEYNGYRFPKGAVIVPNAW
jgi:hypothetical protein